MSAKKKDLIAELLVRLQAQSEYLARTKQARILAIINETKASSWSLTTGRMARKRGKKWKPVGKVQLVPGQGYLLWRTHMNGETGKLVRSSSGPMLAVWSDYGWTRLDEHQLPLGQGMLVWA